jgi:hypothetical protein
MPYTDSKKTLYSLPKRAHKTTQNSSISTVLCLEEYYLRHGLKKSVCQLSCSNTGWMWNGALWLASEVLVYISISPCWSLRCISFWILTGLSHLVCVPGSLFLALPNDWYLQEGINQAMPLLIQEPVSLQEQLMSMLHPSLREESPTFRAVIIG